NGRLKRFDAALLHQLALERLQRRLARLDPAARQMPTGHIAVLHQEDAAVRVDHDGANAEGQPAGEPPISMEDPSNCGLQRPAECLKGHFSRFPNSRIPKCMAGPDQVPVAWNWAPSHF